MGICRFVGLSVFFGAFRALEVVERMTNKHAFKFRLCKRCGRNFKVEGKCIKICPDCVKPRGGHYAGRSDYYRELVRLRRLNSESGGLGK